MSFRNKTNEHAQWAAFLSRFGSSVEELESIQGCLASPDAFEHLIQSDDQTLTSLSEIQWMHLDAIVNRYSTDWQSWFTVEEFPAIYRQRKSRSWTPSQLPVSSRDFDAPRLLVHLWASWNDRARGFDHYFRHIARQFENQITIRSFNVDWPEFIEHFSEADRTQEPCLVFCKSGKRERTLSEFPAEEVLCQVLEDWLDE